MTICDYPYEPIDVECHGCKNIVQHEHCRCYLVPKAKWKDGNVCPQATNIKNEQKEVEK